MEDSCCRTAVTVHSSPVNPAVHRNGTTGKHTLRYGSGNTGANDCYFATLNSTDTSNIADNNNFDGPETVDVSAAYAFEVNGPCTWVKVG